ncbi:MAG TPA: chemotaxis protein CheW [Thermoanaerobaculia bacterium]|nr:chemotaxis protein CheW [Thermoanaerobaculia bacterium]
MSGRGKKDGKGSRQDLAGPERVLLFADSLQETEGEGEERRQELETWVSCRVDRETFALPVAQVQEILRVTGLTRVPHAPYPVRGVTNMRGYVLPVVDLRLRLRLPPLELGPRHRIMVVHSRGRLIGLLVDAVDQVVQIDRLSIEAPPEDVMTEQSYYILGVYHLGEELLILLDADRVLEVREGDEAASG